QQNLDLKFVFIEGTPVRDVISIRKIWDSRGVGFPGYWEGYPLNKFDDIVRDTTIALMPEEKGVKLLSTITGHMMNGYNSAAEFSHNVHTILADGNVIEQFDIIQQCNNNPMYPQGGTWVYARAGWCTGMPGTVREFELTPYIVNNSINFDYDVQSDPNGVYKIDLKMVTYGEISRPADVEMVDIIAPTDNLQHKRYNPTLGNPIIKIKNRGANRLTALEINYGFGTQSFTYQWTGSLSFMKETEVTLPLGNWDAAGGSGAAGTFFVELRNPNGVADPTPYNNKMTSTFKLPPIYTVNDFRMSFKPDTRVSQTKWRVISVAGNVVMAQSQGGMSYGQTYTADITLPSGGYMIELTDAGGDGMVGWLHGEQGLDGAASLRRKTEYDTWISCYTFKADFGDAERFYFGVNQFTGINEQPSNLANLSIYPNPAQTELNLDLTQLTATYATATVYDITGRAIATQQVISGQINMIDISNLTSGMHFITVSEAGHNIWRGKFMKL
ncbi:MAG: T9SS type A sorting domain-containing protein, partial [Bacteroidales bacterium]|nr:T9SS type A sorting domain-containing protein [Bacteroidales bacterium]